MTSLLLGRYREKLCVAYTIAGINADVAQLSRAYLRGDKRGMKKNVTQIIKKLEKVRKLL